MTRTTENVFDMGDGERIRLEDEYGETFRCPCGGYLFNVYIKEGTTDPQEFNDTARCDDCGQVCLGETYRLRNT